MQIKLFQNKSAHNAVHKSVEQVGTIDGTAFVTPLDEETPQIKINSGDISNADYAFLMGSYYFVEGVEHQNNNIYILKLKMDYLMTFKTQIEATKAYIDRASSGYSKLVENNGVSLQCNNVVENMKNNARGFSFMQSDGVYVLTVNHKGA